MPQHAFETRNVLIEGFEAIEAAQGTDPETAVGGFVDRADDATGQGARIVALVTHGSHLAGDRINDVEAIKGADPDASGAVLVHGQHAIVGEAFGIAFTMDPVLPLAAARLKASDTVGPSTGPDAAVPCYNDAAPNRTAGAIR